MPTLDANGGTYTRALAAYASSVDYESLPADVRARIPYLMLDGFGCGIYGSTLEWSTKMADAVLALGSAGTTSLWGTGRKVSADHAALLNGSYVQGYEIDDYSRHGALHACSLVLPAALGAASMRGTVTGAELLAAIVAGFEVGNRVGRCLGPTQLTKQGWHTGAVIGPMAAAATAGVILRLDAEQMEHAFGIAATQAGGLMSAGLGSMVKRMHHGRAAQSGLYAAALASRGYTGIEAVFEQPYAGYCTTFTGSSDRFNLEELVDGLGTEYRMLETCIKPYASCAKVHIPLDALRAIRARRPFELNELQRIRVACTESTMTKVGWTYEGTGSATEAQMNLSYGLAVLLLEGDAFVDQYREELLTSPEVLALTRKVRVEHDESFDALGETRRHHTDVRVEFTDGSVVSEALDFAMGSPSRPLSNEDVAAKYDKLVAGRGGSAAEVRELVLALDTLSDVGPLQDALATA
ncbi:MULTISPECIES: MmgE/PrpD family protein [unclassified Mycobacterium]|uniref:MmgE/PrpD family protein n=1 Tax=unclassified Mycobacterium TaxID=2642494 RepID=UPI0029C6122C|nr:MULTISPECIES: MmgE/PrpD family protein [unclassified Mycobacterium]